MGRDEGAGTLSQILTFLKIKKSNQSLYVVRYLLIQLTDALAHYSLWFTVSPGRRRADGLFSVIYSLIINYSKAASPHTEGSGFSLRLVAAEPNNTDGSIRSIDIVADFI
jgi:hypothetical protein